MRHLIILLYDLIFKSAHLTSDKYARNSTCNIMNFQVKFFYHFLSDEFSIIVENSTYNKYYQDHCSRDKRFKFAANFFIRQAHVKWLIKLTVLVFSIGCFFSSTRRNLTLEGTFIVILMATLETSVKLLLQLEIIFLPLCISVLCPWWYSVQNRRLNEYSSELPFAPIYLYPFQKQNLHR